MKGPIFQGRLSLVRVPNGIIAQPPADVVIPPGYEMKTRLDVAAFVCTYEVVPMRGFMAAYRRWRYPYRKAQG